MRIYNALGQRVQDYQGIDPMTLTYPRDIFAAGAEAVCVSVIPTGTPG